MTAAAKTMAMPVTDTGVRIARLRADVALRCSQSRDAWWWFMALGFARSAGKFGSPAIEAPSSHHNHAIRVHCAMEWFFPHPLRGDQNHSSTRSTELAPHHLHGDQDRI